MDYSLLKNYVYLYLLAYYDGKQMPSYVELAKRLDIARQTASAKVRAMINDELVCINDGIIIVKNPLNIDVNKLIELLNSEIKIEFSRLKKVLFDK